MRVHLACADEPGMRSIVPVDPRNGTHMIFKEGMLTLCLAQLCTELVQELEQRSNRSEIDA